MGDIFERRGADSMVGLARGPGRNSLVRQAPAGQGLQLSSVPSFFSGNSPIPACQHLQFVFTTTPGVGAGHRGWPQSHLQHYLADEAL